MLRPSQNPTITPLHEISGLADRRLEKAITDCQIGGIDAAISYFTENTTPNLIIFETGLSGDDLYEKVGGLADVCDEGTEVLILGTANDVDTYRTLVSEGVSEYLVGPFDAMKVFNAIEAVAIDPDSPPRGQMIAFIGAKGGVGSSTVAANVTWSLAKLYNDDAILLDLDMAFGTVGLAFNQEPQQGMLDALDAADRLDEMLLERFMAVPEDHVKLLCSPVTLENANDVSTQAMDALFELVRRTAPFIIIDIPVVHHFEILL